MNTHMTRDGRAHKTTDYLTKFEFTRVLGLRILQLNKHGVTAEDPHAIALREIRDGTNPAVVRRRLPDGTYEDRAVRELRLDTELRRACERRM